MGFFEPELWKVWDLNCVKVFLSNKYFQKYSSTINESTVSKKENW